MAAYLGLLTRRVLMGLVGGDATSLLPPGVFLGRPGPRLTGGVSPVTAFTTSLIALGVFTDLGVTCKTTLQAHFQIFLLEGLDLTV